MGKTWGLIGRSFSAWNASNAFEWGAALAYYTAFSIAPLIIIALSIVGVFVKRGTLKRGMSTSARSKAHKPYPNLQILAEQLRVRLKRRFFTPV